MTRAGASAEPHVHPTRDDAVLAGWSASVGGPVGTRAGRHPWWSPVRVLLALTAVVLAVGMLQKAPCWEDSWTEESYAAMCYSDLPYLYTGRGFAELAWPWTDDAVVRERYEVMEYPVGIGYAAWAAAAVTHLVTGRPDLDARAAVAPAYAEVLDEVRAFVVVHALLFAVCALLATWFLARVHRRRPWDAAGFAAAPTLALTGLVNWDLLAVVLVAAALWAWARGRPVLTGVLVGLGTATKLYPLFLLGGVLVLCWRRRRWRELAVVVGAAAAAWLVANLPAYLTGPAQWEVFWSFNADRGPDLGSSWLVVAQAGDLAISPAVVNDVSTAAFGLWCLGVLVVGLRAPLEPRLAQLGFLVVAGFLLVNKVYSPQYVLWLLPLAVLARPRWRDLLVWQAGEVFYFAMVWWYLAGVLEPGGGGDAGAYWVAIVVRVLAQLWLVGVVTRDVLRPVHDPVVEERSGPQLTTTRSKVVVV